MIQSSYNKPIAPKASPEVKSSSALKPKDLASALDANDFDKELKSASASKSEKTEKSEKSPETKKTETKSAKTEKLDKSDKTEKSEDKEGEVKAVKVSEEMILEKPSDLLNAQNGQADPTAQKVFDASLTEDVQNILAPKNVEAAPVKLTDEQVIALAAGEVAEVDGEVKGEIAQAMLKTPQVQSGRSPAIEFAQAEIDPQLLGNEDFVAQKNLASKKNLNTSAYGVNKQGQQKLALENGLKQSQIVKEAGALEANNQGPMNSQQFILNMQKDQGSPSMNETQGTQKVFDMSDIKSSNSGKIMDQISNYIVQAKAAKEPTVTMRVNHEELGMIDITVNKSMTLGMDAVAVNIATHTAEGKNFFQQNSKELFSHMSSAGINLSELKVDSPANTAKNEFDFNQQNSGRQGSEGKQQFGSESNQRRHDSDRRQDLWKLLADKEAA